MVCHMLVVSLNSIMPAVMVTVSAVSQSWVYYMQSVQQQYGHHSRHTMALVGTSNGH